MDKQTYKIKINQHLSDIEPFKSKGIPSNCILFKTLPGCGATTNEIEFPRHSIIIEPNVPVIKGKCKQYKNILGIYEKVSIDDVLQYINGDIGYKKLVVTPESFFKIKEAVQQSNFNLYEDFFLLFDECEKIIQDVNYRGDITLPMDDFFLFTNKAYVSATPIEPNDPRFKHYNFKIVELQPTFKYAQPLTLLTTNNIFQTLSKFFKENAREKYFIFFNTTENIADVIKNLKIQDETMVFCADKSVKKLKLNGFKNASSDIVNFKKYNFFTSRFYSAVDIDYNMFNCDPTIIMVSDLVFAQHSMIDPFTEAIQIPGRFRKPLNQSLKREIIHITNIDEDLTSMSKDEVLEYIRECHIVYKAIDRYYETATSIPAKETLRQMLTRIDYAKYIKLPSKSRNYYMIDNLIAEEGVKGLYMDRETLINAYKNNKHFNITCNASEIYTYTDKDRLKARAKNLPLKDVKKILSEKLILLHNLKLKGGVSEFAFSMEIANLQYDFPEQMVPINRLGLDNSLLLKFDIRAIEEKLLGDKQKKDMFGMMTYIQTQFRVGNVYESTEIKRILKTGLLNNKIGGVSPSVKYLRKFADISDSANRVSIKKDKSGKDIRGYKILKFKDNTI